MNEFTVSVFDETLPKIQYNKSYYRKFYSMGDQTFQTRYLQEKQQDFQWILRSIEQRKETISKVASKIIEKQPEFFKDGPESFETVENEGNLG